MDSTGHVELSYEVTDALRITDGANVVVDCIDGVLFHTESVMRQAMAEGIRPVSPEKGTVAFCAGIDGWAFTLSTFAKYYTSKVRVDEETSWRGSGGTISLILRLKSGRKAGRNPRLVSVGQFDLRREEVCGETTNELRDAAMAPRQQRALLEIIFHLPSSATAQSYRMDNMYSDLLDDVYAEAIRCCDPDGDSLLKPADSFNLPYRMIPTSDKKKFLALGRVLSRKVSTGLTVRIMGPNYQPTKKEGQYSKSVESMVIWMGKNKNQKTIEDVPCGNIVAIVGLDDVITKSDTLTNVENVNAHIIQAMKFPVSPLMRIDIQSEAEVLELFKGLRLLDKSAPMVVINDEAKDLSITGVRGVEITSNSLIVTFYESVLDKSDYTIMSMSSNKSIRLYIVARPLDQGLAKTIDDGRISPHDDPEECAKKIWCFGPNSTSPLAGEKTRDICFELCNTVIAENFFFLFTFQTFTSIKVTLFSLLKFTPILRLDPTPHLASRTTKTLHALPLPSPPTPFSDSNGKSTVTGCVTNIRTDEATTKSTPISFYHKRDDNEYPINLMDSSRHVDFSYEVTTALRITDGAIVVVDCIDVVLFHTESVIQQAMAEGIHHVLTMNKMDRCFLELDMDDEEAYENIQKIIEDTNDILRDFQVSPEKGTVPFCAGIDGMAFTLNTLAKYYVSKMRVDEKTMRERLWGTISLILRLKSQFDHRREEVCGETINELRDAMVASRQQHPPRDHIPPPVTRHGQRYRMDNMYSGLLDDVYAEAIMCCDPDGPLMLYVCKMIPTSDKKKLLALSHVFSRKVSTGLSVRIMGLNYQPTKKEGQYSKSVEGMVIRMAKNKNQETVEDVSCGNIVTIVGLDDVITKSVTLTNVKNVNAHIIRAMKFLVSPLMRINIQSEARDLELFEVLRLLDKSDHTVMSMSRNKSIRLYMVARPLD
ncbi:elongation factor 2 [Striga asiatica]|uniref:Elongation factor 2 n=1 Tax=Striga asiatica TaxID=4170 RepID=A0A5A7QCU4_STRAF|nr:elongation factor 2 [Striga asiatica]